jgi:hypothetical protein
VRWLFHLFDSNKSRIERKDLQVCYHAVLLLTEICGFVILFCRFSYHPCTPGEFFKNRLRKITLLNWKGVPRICLKCFIVVGEYAKSVY